MGGSLPSSKLTTDRSLKHLMISTLSRAIVSESGGLGVTEVLRHCRQTLRLRRIYHKFRSFTMIPEAFYLDNLAIAERLRDIPGCVVECGVWRGGMCGGIAEVLGPTRQYFLFDSFEGLPPAKEVDGPAARVWQANVDNPGFYDNCKASLE